MTDKKRAHAQDLLKFSTATLTQRGESHGDILTDFQLTADLWSSYLGSTVKPTDVAQMMVLLKIARTVAGGLNMDDYVDQSGYSAIAGSLADLEEHKTVPDDPDAFVPDGPGGFR